MKKLKLFALTTVALMGATGVANAETAMLAQDDFVEPPSVAAPLHEKSVHDPCRCRHSVGYPSLCFVQLGVIRAPVSMGP